jgi:hypothetical protein
MLVLDSTALGYAPAAAERRVHARRAVDETGELIIPSEDMTLPCRVTNISEGGAGIRCDIIPRAGTRVTLVLQDGRRLESVTAWYGKGELGLRFTAAD